MNSNLLTEYLNTEYKVFSPPISIKVGVYNSELDNLLTQFEKKEWAYITPFNPRSIVLSDKENHRRLADLKQRISGFLYFEGEGVGRDPNWKPEKSFLILGITRNAATKLGNVFEQNAMVYGRIYEIPELVILREMK